MPIYLPHEIPQEWRELLLKIPGYDAIASAEDAWFDLDAAQLALDFFPDCLKHVEGHVSGKPFELEKWQKAIVANLFGWKRKDEIGRTIRRYREVLLYVPRKNGKTPFASGVALLILFTDPEAAQQDFIAASDREQAGKLFKHCKEMVKKEPELDTRCRIYGGNAAAGQSRSIVLDDGSFLRIISADADGAHGDNMHLGIVDELHVQKTRDLLDTMQSATISLNRAQPLLFCLTTADYDRPSICNEKHDYACKVRDGSTTPDGYRDQKFLPIIYEALPNEPWDDESVWIRVNPNLGVSVSLEDLRGECKRAKEVAAYENTFRRLYLNQRTTTAEKVIPMEHWYACGGTIDKAKMRGRPVHVGLDIGATSDFTAMARLYPHDDAEEIKVRISPDELPKDAAEPAPDAILTKTIIRRSYTLLMNFWLPEKPVKRNPRMAAQIDAWIKEGLITVTPGDSVDYDQVLEDMHVLLAGADVVDVAFDRGFQGSQMGTNLMKTWGDKVIAFPQGIISMNAPFREFIELLPVKRLHHEGHKVMSWMVSNTVAERKGGLMKPSKDKSAEKIDGVTAAVMTIGRALLAACKPVKKYVGGSLRD